MSSDDDSTRTGPDVAPPTASPAGAVAAPPAEGDADERPPFRGRFLLEVPLLIAVAVVLSLVIKAFLVQAFYIPSGSMEQTLAISDRVLVNKLVYDFRDVRRGEVVVFNGEGSFSPDPDMLVSAEPTNPVQRAARAIGTLVGVASPGEKDFIKRVIGLPGDRVACCDQGRVTVQAPGGEPVPLEEPYLYENDPPLAFCAAGSSESLCPAGAPGVLVPEGRLFVMGDHRNFSSDSRLHLDDGQSGTVPTDKVIGRAFLVVWPLDHAGVLRVPDTFGGGTLALPAGTLTATPYALGALGALPLVALRRRRRTRA